LRDEKLVHQAQIKLDGPFLWPGLIVLESLIT
jgi:hypothetical protein